MGVGQLDCRCKVGPVARLASAKLIAALERLEITLWIKQTCLFQSTMLGYNLKLWNQRSKIIPFGSISCAGVYSQVLDLDIW